jgi:hypothetical protein
MLRTPDAFLKEGSKVFRPAPADKRVIRSLIQAAQLKAKDVGVQAVSLDTRVEAAYDAVFNCCLAVLNAERYRTGAAPGHHAEALEAACALVGTGDGLFEKLDALRDVRNLKYTGAPRSVADLTEAKAVMERFSEMVVAWLKRKHRDMLRD